MSICCFLFVFHRSESHPKYNWVRCNHAPATPTASLSNHHLACHFECWSSWRAVCFPRGSIWPFVAPSFHHLQHKKTCKYVIVSIPTQVLFPLLKSRTHLRTLASSCPASLNPCAKSKPSEKLFKHSFKKINCLLFSQFVGKLCVEGYRKKRSNVFNCRGKFKSVFQFPFSHWEWNGSDGRNRQRLWWYMIVSSVAHTQAYAAHIAKSPAAAYTCLLLSCGMTWNHRERPLICKIITYGHKRLSTPQNVSKHYLW